MIKFLIIIFLVLKIFNIQIQAQIRVKAVGDIMLGSVTPKEILPPENGEEFVKSISNYLVGAEIVFGNLEGSFIHEGMEPDKCSERSRETKRCYEFGMPENLAPSLKEMGFNVLSLDNNHSEDYGIEGYEFTKRKLDSLDIYFAEKRGVASLIIGNKRVGLAALGYSENSLHISDTIMVKIAIEKLKKDFDIIIVSFHGGAEGLDARNVEDSTEYFLGENRGNVYAFAHAAIDAGADMVIGHGPHVLRAIEVYKNKLIAYSLGNFLTYGNMNISGIKGTSVILEAVIDSTNGNFLRGKLIPTRQAGFGIPQYDESREGIQQIIELTKADFPKAGIILLENGLMYNSEMFLPQIKPKEETGYLAALPFVKLQGVELPANVSIY